MALSTEQVALLDALLRAGSGAAGMWASNNTANNQLQGSLGQTTANALLGYSGQRGNLTNTGIDSINSAATRRQQGAQAAGSLIGGPMNLAQSRAQFANRRAFLFGNGGNPQYITPNDASIQMPNMPTFRGNQRFYSDEAMAASEQPYHQALSLMTGGRIGGDAIANSPYLKTAGVNNISNSLGKTAADASAMEVKDRTDIDNLLAQGNQNINSSQAATLQALQQDKTQQTQKKESGWKKFLKVALPMAAMAIPFAGPALGMSALAAGATAAGAGAVGGALNNGWQGAITGGATGALSGYGANKMNGGGGAPPASLIPGTGNIAQPVQPFPNWAQTPQQPWWAPNQTRKL